MPSKQPKCKLPDFDLTQKNLTDLAIEKDPAELHGVLSAFVCVGAIEPAEQFMQSILTDKDIKKHEMAIRATVSLLQTVIQQMKTISFDFHLLLPDDDAPLSNRAKAMSLWCSGFSEGFLQSGIDLGVLKTEESRDALYHITEISQLDYAALTIGEDDEKAYMELYEYVRTAVLMLHTEITHSSVAPTNHPDDDKTVH